MLDVEDFTLDECANVCESEYVQVGRSVNHIFSGNTQYNRLARPPVLRWKNNGQWFAAVIPIKTKLSSWSTTFSSGVDKVVDYGEMFLDAAKITRAHNELIALKPKTPTKITLFIPLLAIIYPSPNH